MRTTLIALKVLLATALYAQTDVRTASTTFSVGVCPTFSVDFTGTDKVNVEKWFKDQLKPVSADIGGKKEVMSIGTRLPEVSGDTIRVFVKAEQTKGAKEVTAHAAFRVNMSFVGPDAEEHQRQACRDWVYRTSVGLKKHLAQVELDAAKKKLGLLEDDYALLKKENGRAQNGIEKTRRNIVKDEQEKAATEGEITMLETRIATVRQETALNATPENTKALQALEKEDAKLKKRVSKLAKSMESGKKKVESLQQSIKKNLADQDAKAKAVDTQKKLVEELTTRLVGIH